MNESKWMRVKFENLQIFHRNPTVNAYYSITYNEKLYFSSVFDDESVLSIKNDIIIPLQTVNAPQSISLQRWQSHVIVFDHQILLGQLKTKTIIKRKFQARKNQIITFSIILSGEKDIIICDTLIKSVSQHYLLLENIRMRQENLQKRGDVGACYFKIITSQSQFDIPVQNGNCLIYLPQTFQIQQYKNGNFYSRSKSFSFNQLSGIQKIQLYTTQNKFVGKVQFDALWIVDQSIPSPVQYLLHHSSQILLWQFQIKFDNPNDFIGSKMKVSCNNKLFEFNDQLGNSKMIRIKKACWVIAKSQSDHIQVKIQRNNQILSRVDILVQQLINFQLLKFKQKLLDATNPLKSIGMIKFNLQKSKGATNPQNQNFWKQCIKKKSTGSLIIEQMSAFHKQDERLCIVVKTQNDQKRIDKVLNANFFEDQPLIYHNPILINPKLDETLYFMVKPSDSDANSQDFLGIAILNAGDMKLGKHPYEIDFYKNQQKMGSISCLITKYVPITFVKSIFMPEILPLNKILQLQLSMTTMTLSPYFFSYKYDNQKQVFCIVQVNKIKKVLILQPTYQELSFVPASTSDNLSFTVDVDQIVKIKITIMVGDGLQEIIYGAYSTTIKMDQLRQKQQINKKQVRFLNFAETFVGKCNILIKIHKQTIKRLEKSKSKQKLPFQSGRNRSSNSKKQPKNKSISMLQYITPQLKQQKQIKMIKNLLPIKKHHQKDNAHNSFHYDKKDTSDSKLIPKFQSKQSVKLPHIKQHQKRKQSFSDLFVSMNVRKRTLGGYDYNKPLQDDKTYRQNKRQKSISNQYSQGNKGDKQSFNKQRQQYSNNRDRPIDYQNLRDSNPNIDKNFEMLFPAKKGQTKQQHIKNELNKYEQKLRGLKSVLNQISNDIDPIEPSVKDGGNNTEQLSNKQANNFQYAGNEFL